MSANPRTTSDSVVDPVVWSVRHGVLAPAAGHPLDPASVLAHLETTRVVAAVADTAQDDLVEWAVAVTGRGDELRVGVVGPTGPTPGPPLVDWAQDLARALGAEVGLGVHWYGEPGSPEAEDELPDDENVGDENVGDEVVGDEAGLHVGSAAHRDVVVSRIVASMVPPVARGLGVGMDAAVVDGWQVMHLDEQHVDVAGEGWLPGDLPVVSLGRGGDVRTVHVVTKVFGLDSLELRRHPHRHATVNDGLPPDLAEALTSPHHHHDSPARTVADSKYFERVEADVLIAALQSPMDDRWSSRVLAALGLPTVAADVHEGRSDLAGATRFEPLSLWAMTVDGVRRHYDPGEAEISRRKAYGRAYARVTATPGRTAALVAVELVLLAATLWGLVQTDGIGRWVLVLVALTLAGEVVWHSLMAPAKFRRRR